MEFEEEFVNVNVVLCFSCAKFEDVWKRYQDLNATLSDKDDLEFTLKRTILERDHLKCDLAKVTEERDDLEPKLHELRTKVRDLSNVEAENCALESQVSSLNRSLKERVTHSRVGTRLGACFQFVWDSVVLVTIFFTWFALT